MVTQAPSRGVVAVTVMFALSCIGLILFVWSSLGGSTALQPEGYRFHALFADASQLNANADVRVAGVSVGKVIRVKQVGLNTDATIQLEPAYAPLAADARAILRQKTLLGETFVALTTGTKTAPRIPENGRLAATRIGERQPLDRLLGALDPQTRRNLQALLTGSATALRGRGADLNAALGNLDPTAESLAAIAKVLDHQQGAVGGLVRNTGMVLGTLADRDSDVDGLVRNGRAVLSTTARRDRAITAAVRRLPGFVTQLRSTMASVDRTGLLAAPVLHDLRPAARDALPAVAGLDRLAPKATELFGQFERLVPTARRALPAIADIVVAITPFSDALYPAAQNIVPVIDFVNLYKQELVSSAANVAASTQASSPDSGGADRHYLRVVVPFTEEGLVGFGRRLPSNRHNAYPAPGTWAAIGRQGLPASDCRNTSNPATVPPLGTGAPPCRVQDGFEYGGKKRYFPSVQPATP